MTTCSCHAERRRHPRFRIEPRAYVINAARPGLITDISMEGLSWRYVDRKSWPESSSPTLDILVEDREISLAGLPYRIVSDCEAEHDCPDRSLTVRRRSVQFGELTARQRAQLEYLIQQKADTLRQQAGFLN